MVEFCYLRLFLRIETVSRLLLPRMAKMDSETWTDQLFQVFKMQKKLAKINSTLRLLSWLVILDEIWLIFSSSHYRSILCIKALICLRQRTDLKQYYPHDTAPRCHGCLVHSVQNANYASVFAIELYLSNVSNKNRRKAIFNWAAKGLFLFWGEGAAIHPQPTIKPCRRPLRETESHVRLKHKLIQNIVPFWKTFVTKKKSTIFKWGLNNNF